MINIYYKAALFDAAIELQKIRNLIPEEKANKIRKILVAKISYKQKLKRFEAYKKDLKEAEKYFCKFTDFLKKSSVHKGYKNFIDELAKNNKIPQKNLENLVKDSQKITSFINQKVRFKKGLPKEYWSEHYLTFPKHKSQKEYQLEEVYKIWQESDPLAKEIIKKIKIIKDEEASCLYNKNKKIFEIRCSLKYKTIPSIFTFIHELGHARQEMEMIKENKNHLLLTNYQKEKYAHRFALELARKIAPEEEFWAYLWFKTKDLIVNGLFEYFIYKNNAKKPSKLYANLHNQFYGQKYQKENYYYLTLKPILLENGRFFITAISFIQAFKEIIIQRNAVDNKF
ncbi:MAG: hypothetical protein KatS3mg088_451 [Patescibacteria group bacterium]|nr:MAG: hypothetical protein KatS3mg088_451 [Patescibacteria group bacterium]